MFESKSNKELMDFEIPEHINFGARNQVFDYLDQIGLEYVKAECSMINYHGEMKSVIINYNLMPVNLKLRVPGYSRITGNINDSQVWNQIQMLLSGVIISKIKEKIDFILGQGVDNLKNHTVLFDNFSKTIMERPKNCMTVCNDWPIDHSDNYRYFSIISYFDIVDKCQYGITPQQYIITDIGDV